MNRMPLSSLPMSRAFSDLATDMEGIMNHLFTSDGEKSGAGFVPHLDISETDDGYTVVADLPGAAAEDIDLDLQEDRLVIAGQRATRREDENVKYLRRERQSGKFHRTVLLPKAVDRDAISAHFEHGVLTITLPKMAEVKPRRIEIKVGDVSAE